MCARPPPPIRCIVRSGPMPASRAGAGANMELPKTFYWCLTRLILGTVFSVVLGLC